MKPKTDIELLAPAGNLLSGVTAIDYGADAVYAGLPRFNARERTENLSFEELAKLINYAHSHHKKAYLVLNTLVKEQELTDVAEILGKVTDLGPDAIIVQDLGLVSMIRDFFPQLQIHASTQMGIHNSAGVTAAAQLGISRVILERQVTLSELKQIIKKSALDIEVFVHGALCCSLSGVCLFSSWVSGSSGNRGKCLQLCRRKFYTGSDQSGFYLSPKDLGLIDCVPALKECGVASLKIEGRLRKPDYLKNVVSAYRLMIDAAPSEYSNALEKARGFLAKTGSRTLAHGFLSDTDMKQVIESGSPGVSGILIGKPGRVSAQGLEIKLKRRLHVGDKIRAQNALGDASKIITVASMKLKGKSVTRAGKGDTCWVATQHTIPAKSLIYKTGESYKEMTAKLATIPVESPLPVKLNIAIQKTGFNIEADNRGKVIDWSMAMEVAAAQKHALAEKAVITEFAKVGKRNWEVVTVECQLEDNLFIPASVLKKIRQEFYDFLDDQFSNLGKQNTIGRQHFKRFMETYQTQDKVVEDDAPICHTVYQGQTDEPHAVECRSSRQPFIPGSEIQLPFFCAEKALGRLADNINKLYQAGARRFRVTSLFQLALLNKYQDLQLVSSYPLPVCNSMAVRELKKRTLKRCQAWVELEQDSFTKLQERAPLKLELFVEGALPILLTRVPLTDSHGCFEDNRGKQYNVRFDTDTGLYFVYPQDALKIEAMPGFDLFTAEKITNNDPEQTADFNLHGEWK